MARSIDIRERIIQLAIDAIEGGGEEAIRVSDIARDAGVTMPTLYRHFGSRDGLVEVAQLQRFKRTQFLDSSVFAATVMRCKTQDEFRKALRKELLTHFDKDRWAVRQIRINALGSGYARPILQAQLAFAQHQEALAVAQILKPVQKKGWIRKDIDLTAASYWYMSQIMGRALIEMGNNPIAEKKWNDLFLTSIETALFGSPTKK